jgi:hypothetical protein
MVNSMIAGVIFVALLSAVRLRNDLLAIMLAVAYGLVLTLAPGATRPPIVRERWLDRIGSVGSISAGMGSNQAPSRRRNASRGRTKPAGVTEI